MTEGSGEQGDGHSTCGRMKDSVDKHLFTLALLTLGAELLVLSPTKKSQWTECARRNGSVSLKNTPLFQDCAVWHRLNVSRLNNGSTAKDAISYESGTCTAKVELN